REVPRACGNQPHRTRTELAPPALGIGLLFRSCSLIELPSDVEKQLAGFAHGCTSSEKPGAGAWQIGGWSKTAPLGCGKLKGLCEDVPAQQRPGSVDRGEEAAGGAIEREASVLPGRALTVSCQSLHVAPDRT